MTPAARLRKAKRFMLQLWAIRNRTPAEEVELVWWERRVLLLERECFVLTPYRTDDTINS